MTTAIGPRRRAAAAIPLLLFFVLLATALPLPAAEVQQFRQQSRDSFLPGTLDGVGIDPLGTLRLADRVERLADVEEPFVFAAAPHPEGWVLGTGNAGRVVLVRRDGSSEVLFEAPEPEIFAVWADPDGTVFAGSSPDGKVYRIADGAGEAVFEPGETYIWDLARGAGGELLVATGTRGRLYRVDGEGAAVAGEVYFESDDVHVRSLKLLPDGDLLVGTAGEGLILRLAPDGTARTLYDADQPEVVAFAAAPGGACYAAVLASEASRVDLSAGSGEKGDGDDDEDDDGDDGDDDGAGMVTITVVEGDATPGGGSRPSSFAGARSAVLRIAESGLVEKVWSFSDETVYDILWHRDRLWVATGLEGKLYSLDDGEMVLEKDIDERQVVALLADRPGPAFATTNAGAVYRVAAGTERSGSYTSPSLDAAAIARLGTLRWEGELPAGAGLAFSARSGMSAEPDRTWSAWSAAASGREIALAGVPDGRYVQWRAELEAADGTSPVITGVTLSYRQRNLAPRIERLRVLEPGKVVVEQSFNPANQIFEPVTPTREGIFTTLEASDERPDPRTKTLWKRGYLTLRWDAEDENDDDLTYDLRFRPERPGTASAGSSWMPLAEDLEQDWYSFDAMTLPDGLYRFQLRASDAADNVPAEALVAEEVSVTVTVDHTPPRLGEVARRGDTLVVEVTDELSPLARAEFSVDADGWSDPPTADRLLDSRGERLEIRLPDDGELLLLRVMDAAFNVVTFDLSGELP